MDKLGKSLDAHNEFARRAEPLRARIFDLEHVLFLVEGFLRVGKFDKTNVDALTHIVGHALRKSEQE